MKSDMQGGLEFPEFFIIGFVALVFIGGAITVYRFMKKR